MNKRAIVTIKGFHMAVGTPDEEEDIVEATNVAEYYYRNGAHYFLYDDLEPESKKLVHNRLKIKDQAVEITKTGEISSNMNFHLGETQQSSYRTPAGAFAMGIQTNSLKIQDAETKMAADIEYEMFLNYEHVANCRVSIQIKFMEE